MKKITLIVLFVVYSLYAIEFVDEKEYSDTIVGNRHLNGAKFLGSKIWQDQPINTKINYMDFNEAKKYCKNLKLLGIKGWSLPTKIDAMMLDDEKDKLRYIARGCPGFGYCSRRNEFYTKTFGTYKGKRFVYTIDLDNGKTPYISTTKTKYLNTKTAVRCVLDPNIYNKYKLSQSKKEVKNGDIDAYLKAFLDSGNKTYIKKALKLAKDRSDKAKIEATLYRYLGFFKLFDVIQNGTVLDKDGKDFDTNSHLFAAIQKSKNLKYKFDIKPKKNTPLKLRYNTYIVTMIYNLALHYTEVTMGIGMGKTKRIQKEVTFKLSPKNGYQASVTVDFGEVEQGTKARLFFINQSRILKSAVLKYDIKDTKVELLK